MDEKPIVLFLIDSLVVGGAEKSLLTMLPLFKDFRPLVCTVYREGTLVQEFRDKGIEVRNLAVKKKYGYGLAAKRLKLLIDEVQPVLIHSSLKNADFIARKVKSSCSLPLVTSIVSDSYSPYRLRHMSFLMRMKVKIVQFYDILTIKKVDCFFSNSEAISIATQKDLCVSAKKIKVIYRGRNSFSTEKKTERKIEVEGKVLDLNEKKVLLNVSRLIDTKGHIDLVEAVAKTINKMPNLILLIAGEGSYRKKIEEAIVLHQMQEHVILLGNRDDVHYLFSLSDLFVFSSYYEGLPGALIEAMYSNTPIVASDIKMNLECVDSELAEMYPVGQTQILSKKIIYVFEHYEQALQKANLALNVAFQKFNLENIARIHEFEYKRILKEIK